MTRATRRRLIAAVAAMVISLGTAGSALAAWSALVSGAGAAAAGTMPDGPTPTAVLNGTDTTVSWTAASLAGDATPSYLVQRYAGSTATTPAGSCAALVTDLQCTDSNAAEGTWTYAVTVAKGSWRGTEGARSAEVHVPTFAPTSLTAGVATRTSVSLNWSDNSLVEDGYRVQRLVDGDWVNVGDLLPAGATTGVDSTITCGITRTYRVLAIDADNGNSAPSNEVEATASACPSAEAQPTDLVATSASATQIDLTWTDNATGETGYRVEVSPDGSVWSTLATLAANSTSHQDQTVTCGSTRHYRVVALGEIDSNASGRASATAGPCAGPPAAPTNLSGTGVSPTTIALSWTDNSANETKFVLERSTNSQFNAAGSVQSIDIPANGTSYDDTAAAAGCGITRYYRLRAVNTSGESAFVSTTASTLACPPAAPTLGVSASVHTLNLSWSAISGATGYKIERQNPATSVWEQIATPASASYADVLACGQSRNYRVRATNAGGDSAYSNEAAGSTQACAPTGAPALSGSVTGHTANLSWTAVADAAGYRVERQNGTGWDLAATTTSRTHTETIPCTQSRTYRVRAYNVGGDAATSSNSVTLTSGACPKAVSVELVASSSTRDVGTINAGDKVVVTYDSSMSVSSFCSVWANDAASQSLAENNDVTLTVSASDVLTVTSGKCAFKFGSVALGGNYVTATANFRGDKNNAKSTIDWSPSTKKLTITFGPQVDGTLASSAVTSGTATYTPHADLRDTANNPIATTPVSTANQHL